MKVSFIDATWNDETRLSNEAIEYIKKSNAETVALFASVQFLALDIVTKQLEEIGVNVLDSKAKRTNKRRQILGCDVYHDSFDGNIITDADLIIYIGDGLFHPQALLYAQVYSGRIRDVLIFDPVGNNTRFIGRNEILPNIKKLKANIIRYLSSQNIGILVTLKHGQQYLNLALKLKEEVEKEGKNAYIFIDNTIDYSHFENFPFIECFVNTACPRIGLDDILKIPKPLINVRDIYMLPETLEQLDKIIKSNDE